MSVDRTIEELSGTLTQLGVLVEHINAQIVGISSRVNLTLDNFDHAVAGIATDAGLITGQVGEIVSQVPSSWVFYMLFISLVVVLVLLSILIIISLIARIYNICKLMRGINTPLPSLIYSESKQPLNISYPASPQTRERLRHIAVPMEAEPKRYGYGARTHPIDFNSTTAAVSDSINYAAPNRKYQPEACIIKQVYPRNQEQHHHLTYQSREQLSHLPTQRSIHYRRPSTASNGTDNANGSINNFIPFSGQNNLPHHTIAYVSPHAEAV